MEEKERSYQRIIAENLGLQTFALNFMEYFN